jgi:hypothetical protein
VEDPGCGYLLGRNVPVMGVKAKTSASHQPTYDGGVDDKGRIQRKIDGRYLQK